jgi:hypothetical protein
VPQDPSVPSSENLELLGFEAKLSCDPTEGNRSGTAAVGPTEIIRPWDERCGGEGRGAGAVQSSARAEMELMVADMGIVWR